MRVRSVAESIGVATESSCLPVDVGCRSKKVDITLRVMILTHCRRMIISVIAKKTHFVTRRVTSTMKAIYQWPLAVPD